MLLHSCSQNVTVPSPAPGQDLRSRSCCELLGQRRAELCHADAIQELLDARDPELSIRVAADIYEHDKLRFKLVQLERRRAFLHAL